MDLASAEGCHAPVARLPRLDLRRWHDGQSLLVDGDGKGPGPRAVAAYIPPRVFIMETGH